MKHLMEPVSRNKIDAETGHILKCPSCGAGTDSHYKGAKFLGSHCRECELLWTVKMVDGCPQIGSTKVKRIGKRTYEIVVKRTEHFIMATSAEDARKKLLKKLVKKKGSSEGYGIYVEHLMDHAECNEGIC